MRSTRSSSREGSTGIWKRAAPAVGSRRRRVMRSTTCRAHVAHDVQEDREPVLQHLEQRVRIELQGQRVLLGQHLRAVRIAGEEAEPPHPRPGTDPGHDRPAAAHGERALHHQVDARSPARPSRSSTLPLAEEALHAHVRQRRQLRRGQAGEQWAGSSGRAAARPERRAARRHVRHARAPFRRARGGRACAPPRGRGRIRSPRARKLEQPRLELDEAELAHVVDGDAAHRLARARRASARAGSRSPEAAGT